MTGIPSCEDDCMCCDLEGQGYYDARIVDFQVDRIDKRVAPNKLRPYLQGDTVDADGDIVIYFDSYFERIALNMSSPTGGLFINTAYACTPAYLPRTEQKFVKLTITSTEDYDPDHPAGTDLIDLFVTRGEQVGTNDQKMPLTQHLAMNSDFFIHSPPWVFLNKNPEHVTKHIFMFELELSDTTFTFQTPEIILK